MKSLFIIPIAVIASVSARSLLCEPNSIFKDDCNTCTCSSDGSSVDCTKISCEFKEEPKQVCKPESRFKEFCNTCFCDENGQSYSCTKRTCDPSVWNKNGSRKIDLPKRQICIPSTNFMKDCNLCFCSPDGTFIGCTISDCDGFAQTGMDKNISLQN